MEICSIRNLTVAVLFLPAFALAVPTLQLDSSAKAMVPNDEMVVAIAVERVGQDIKPLNDGVLEALNAVVSNAKTVPLINVKLGNILTTPTWAAGKVNGWRVRGEMVLDSKDLWALSNLAVRLSKTVQLSSVSFRLSAEKREAEENSLGREAIASFRRKADASAQAFGFKSYELKEIVLGRGTASPKPAAKTSSPPVAVEAGDSEVVVTVTGSVELK